MTTFFAFLAFYWVFSAILLLSWANFKPDETFSKFDCQVIQFVVALLGGFIMPYMLGFRLRETENENCPSCSDE